MEKKYYKLMYSRLTVAELWGAVDGNLYLFLKAFIRYKLFGRQRAYDFGTVRTESLKHIDPAQLPDVVKAQLENLQSECAREGISIELVMEEANLSPDLLYILLLSSDDPRILNIIIVHVSPSQPSRSCIRFKCVTFCSDGQVIETNDRRWDMRGPPGWKIEHHPGCKVRHIRSRHLERVASLAGKTKSLTLEEAEQEIATFTNIFIDYCISRGVMKEMTEAEVRALKWMLAEVHVRTPRHCGLIAASEPK